MRKPSLARRVVALAVLLAFGAICAFVGCGPDQSTFWLCLNPVTGKEDGTIYDADHYVDGVLDPCNCYDPCGPEKTCPITVDAGPPGPGCADAGDGG
jgi:hypothetical protein